VAVNDVGQQRSSAPACHRTLADNARLNGRGRAVRNEGQRAGASYSRLTGRTTAPIFLLVPQVTLKKRLDVDAAARTWTGRLPGLIETAWPGGRS